MHMKVGHPAEGSRRRATGCALTGRPRGRRRAPAGPTTGAALALHERAVLADQQIEMVAFFVGKLQEDLLALGVFESLAVFLEEPMRAALASNTDHQGLLIVDAAHQPFGALGEEAVGGAFEEEERWARLELGIAPQQLAIARLEFAEVFLLLHRQILKDLATARILGHARRAGVEIEAAALGGDRNAQRVAREHQYRCALRSWPSTCGRCGTRHRFRRSGRRFETAEKLRAAATSSIEASMSELRNSNERWQLLQIRWK